MLSFSSVLNTSVRLYYDLSHSKISNVWLKLYLDIPISSNDKYFIYFTNTILSSWTWMSVSDYASVLKECGNLSSNLALCMRDLKQSNDNMILPMFSKAGIILKHVEDKGVMSFLLLHHSNFHFFFFCINIMKNAFNLI